MGDIKFNSRSGISGRSYISDSVYRARNIVDTNTVIALSMADNREKKQIKENNKRDILMYANAMLLN